MTLHAYYWLFECTCITLTSTHKIYLLKFWQHHCHCFCAKTSQWFSDHLICQIDLLRRTRPLLRTCLWRSTVRATSSINGAPICEHNASQSLLWNRFRNVVLSYEKCHFTSEKSIVHVCVHSHNATVYNKIAVFFSGFTCLMASTLMLRIEFGSLTSLCIK